MDKKYFLILPVLAFKLTTGYANDVVSQDWVLQQVALNPPQLTAADWKAICTTGSPTNSNGCYGNVTSAAFTKVSNYLGGFTRYANINPVNLASSVFVKAFLGGTNTPAQANSLTTVLTSSAARCALFTEVGFGLGPGGAMTYMPSSGNTSGAYPPPQGLALLSINNESTTNISYQMANPPTIGGPTNQSPIYLLCAGYNATDGSTATAINVAAT